MPSGVYKRTEYHIKINRDAQKIAQNRRDVVEKKSKSEKIAQNRDEVREKKRLTWQDIAIKNRQSKIMKEISNRNEVKEKKSKARIEYMGTHKGNFRDTSIEIQLHKILLMIFKEDEIIKQFYVKDVVRIDFYIPKDNLVLEADSVYYHMKPDRQERDRIRTEKMQALGYKVLRFWDYELRDIEYCLNKIKEVI